MQEALTAVFGFGVLTVATVALLNVACLRLHDVQKKEQKKGKKDLEGGAEEGPKTAIGSEADELRYVYVYNSANAFAERDRLRHLPSFLAWTGVGAIVLVQVLYGIAYLTAPHAGGDSPCACPSDRGPVTVLDIITWMSIASYVLVLLCVAAWVSNRVYGVLSRVNRG